MGTSITRARALARTPANPHRASMGSLSSTGLRPKPLIEGD
jgi:hypothetical protein